MLLRRRTLPAVNFALAVGSVRAHQGGPESGNQASGWLPGGFSRTAV